MLWVNASVEAVDAKCRERGADPEGRRSDFLRGCADFCGNGIVPEIFAIPDPGVIAHEVWHAATRSVVEPRDTCPINAPGEGPQ